MRKNPYAWHLMLILSRQLPLLSRVLMFIKRRYSRTFLKNSLPLFACRKTANVINLYGHQAIGPGVMNAFRPKISASLRKPLVRCELENQSHILRILGQILGLHVEGCCGDYIYSRFTTGLCVTTSSINPKFCASSAEKKVSLSRVRLMTSNDCPV